MTDSETDAVNEHVAFENWDIKFQRIRQALEEKDINKVKDDLKKGFPIEHRDERDCSLLMYAAKYGFVLGTKELLDYGAKPDTPDQNGITALHAAARSGRHRVIKCLLKVFPNADIRDKFGRTPLHYASKVLHNEHNESVIKLVETLLNSSANAIAKSNDGLTPLHGAAMVGNSQILPTLLRGQGIIALNLRESKHGMIPLHYAVMNGRCINTVEILLQYKSPIDAKDDRGRTPLHLISEKPAEAVDDGFSGACLELLMCYGASVLEIDLKGHNALSHCLRKTMWWGTQTARQAIYHGSLQSSVKLLIGKGSIIQDTFDLWRMIETFPSLVMVGLNQSIKINTQERNSHHLSVTFDFRPFIKNTRILEEINRSRFVQKDDSNVKLQKVVIKRSSVCQQVPYEAVTPKISFPNFGKFSFMSHSSKSKQKIKNEAKPRKIFDLGKSKNKFKTNFTNSIYGNPNKIQVPQVLLADSEVMMLHFILRSNQRQILRHPLCSIFLHLKWLRIRKYFALNVLFHFAFVIALTIFILHKPGCDQKQDESSEDYYTRGTYSESGHSFDTNYNDYVFPDMRKSKYWTWDILLVFNVIMIIRETIQLIHCPQIYLSHHENYIDMLIIVCTFHLTLWAQEYKTCFTVWQVNTASVVAVASWSKLMLSIGQFPSCGLYIIMFTTVFKTVTKFLAMYLPLLIAFALGFSVFLKEMDTFKDFPQSIVTTVVMMTGELSYAEEQGMLMAETAISAKVFLFSILIIFILFVYIIMSNLLVALAISDMNSINKRSELLRLTHQVKLVVQAEAFARSTWFPSILREIIERQVSITRVKTRNLDFKVEINSSIIHGRRNNITGNDNMFYPGSHSHDKENKIPMDDGKEKESSAKNERRDGFITIRPNQTYCKTENLYLMLLSIFRCKRFLIKIFDYFSMGFIPPEDEPSLPPHLVDEALQLALKELEIDKRDQLLFSRMCAVNTSFRDRLVGQRNESNERFANVMPDSPSELTLYETNDIPKYSTENNDNNYESQKMTAVRSIRRDSNEPIRKALRKMQIGCRTAENSGKREDDGIDEKLDMLNREVAVLQKMIGQLTSSQQLQSSAQRPTLSKKRYNIDGKLLVSQASQTFEAKSSGGKDMERFYLNELDDNDSDDTDKNHYIFPNGDNLRL